MKTILQNKIMKGIILLLLTLFTQEIFAQTISDANGDWTITYDGRGIKISFDPNPAVVACTDIRLVQTLKMTFFNAAGVGTVVNPADIHKNFKHLGDDTTSDTTVVDHLWCEKDEAYNGNDAGQDKSSPGNGPAGTPTSMADYPYIGDNSFPAGMVKVLLEFEVCAICNNAPYNSISCIKWKYERNKGGGDGISTLLSGAPAPQSVAHAAATAKFIQKHTDSTGTKICPEEVALVNAFTKWYDLNGPFWFKANHSYDVLYAGNRVKKGVTPPGASLPSLPVGNSIAPTDFVFVPAGDRLCIRRTTIIPAIDPSIPFQASFTDVFFGSAEAVETGVLSGTQHTGIRVKNCGGVTLCAVAPTNSTNPSGHVMFTARINNATQQVILKNNALSTHGISCKDVLHAAAVSILNPGDSIVYSFPGQVPSCASTLNLKLFIQGYMDGSNGMLPVLYNQGQEAGIGACDSIDVELHSAAPPFSLMHTSRTVLNQDGSATCIFPQINGNYFVAVKHRNAIETWSANPINIIPGSVFYDFSNNANKAFGANQAQIAPGVFAFYSGDLNHDESIDLLDVPGFENDVNAFIYGYEPSDINGDGGVDLLDYPLIETNIYNFIFSNQPN